MNDMFNSWEGFEKERWGTGPSEGVIWHETDLGTGNIGTGNTYTLVTLTGVSAGGGKDCRGAPMS